MKQKKSIYNLFLILLMMLIEMVVMLIYLVKDHKMMTYSCSWQCRFLLIVYSKNEQMIFLATKMTYLYIYTSEACYFLYFCNLFCKKVTSEKTVEAVVKEINTKNSQHMEDMSMIFFFHVLSYYSSFFVLQNIVDEGGRTLQGMNKKDNDDRLIRKYWLVFTISIFACTLAEQ